jgi:hypothetical protein
MPRMPSQDTPLKRRIKARQIRGRSRWDGPRGTEYGTLNMQEIADKHGVSLAHAKRIVDELEAWESTVTFQDEADEINSYLPGYHPMKWDLVSGRMLHAYIQGELAGHEKMLGGAAQAEPDIEAADESTDPLLL